jgi:ABC-type sugar transport system ATPase subunit
LGGDFAPQHARIDSGRISMEKVLEVNKISKSFGGINALVEVDLEFNCGEVHCIVGENGAGKSTLGKIISGIHSPDSGELIFQNISYKELNPAKAKDLKIAMVTQELNLMPHLTISENIFMFEKESYRNGIINRQLINDKTEKLFEQFQLSNLPPVTTKVENLTLAQQQIVEIMKAISQKNNLLVFDEPTTTLSITEVDQLFKLIRRLKAENVAIILVTHRLREIFEIGDIVTVLCDGQIVKSRIPVKGLDDHDLVKYMVGRNIKDFYGVKEKLKIGNPVLEVTNLSDGLIFKDVSFTVHESEILGFAGLVGAGRTEIMETIFGIREQKSGNVLLKGQSISEKSTKDRVKLGVSFVPEDRKNKGLAINLPIGSNMSQVDMNLKDRLIVFEKQFSAKNLEIGKRLNLKFKGLDQKVTNLSGGNQQKVLLSKWLSQNPLIYIFDEPTRGIDVGTKTEVYDLIKNLAKEGKAILMVSSELQELIAICDRIVVVNEGRISAIVNREDATEPKILKEMIPVK